MDIKVTVTNDVLKRLEKSFDNPQPFFSFLGERFLELTRQNILAGKQPNQRAFLPNNPITVTVKRGNRPLIDKGHLLKSLKFAVGKGSLIFGSNLPYAAIQNFGGVIHAKKQFLTIPLMNKARQVGIGAGAKKYGGDKRNVGLFFVRILKTGNCFLAKRIGSKKKPKLEFWYWLKRSVKIPPRAIFPKTNISGYPKYVQCIMDSIKFWLKI